MSGSCDRYAVGQGSTRNSFEDSADRRRTTGMEQIPVQAAAHEDRERAAALTQASCDIFLEVAIRLQFASAARHLYVDASTVSRSIARLERSLGVRLFDRTTRTMRLTEQGQRLLVSLTEREHAASGPSLGTTRRLMLAEVENSRA